MTLRSAALAALALAAGGGLDAPIVDAAELASPWSQDKPETKARLIAGRVTGAPVAAVQIELADGWKTYWRFPGDAGGVPPLFDWAKSENVATIKVLYPQPKRFTDKTGDTLGYKDQVVFPLEVTPKDAAKPVVLKLTLDYGICREVCIPVEAELGLDIPLGDANGLPAVIATANEHVPRSQDARRPGDPKLTSTVVKLDGPRPSITIEAQFPGGVANADAYVESPEGFYIPLPKAGSAKAVGPDTLRFEIDLTGAVDPVDIKGKLAKVTLVSDHGLTEATFKLE